MSTQSVTVWLEEVKQGDDEAARQLWDRFFPDLVQLARRKLSGVPRRMEDEEDVALSVFSSFCAAAGDGRFPHLNDRHDLWRLLAHITNNKAVDLIRRANRKFGDAHVRPLESSRSDAAGGANLVEQDELSAEAAVMVTEELRRLIDILPDDQLQQIAVLKMEGYTNKDMAQKLDCALRTIERRLALIRDYWEDEIDSVN